MSQEKVVPVHLTDDLDKISDDSKAKVLQQERKTSDPDFEDKIELKYEDCPEKTGFAYPSATLSVSMANLVSTG